MVVVGRIVVVVDVVRVVDVVAVVAGLEVVDVVDSVVVLLGIVLVEERSIVVVVTLGGSTLGVQLPDNRAATSSNPQGFTAAASLPLGSIASSMGATRFDRSSM